MKLIKINLKMYKKNAIKYIHEGNDYYTEGGTL